MSKRMKRVRAIAVLLIPAMLAAMMTACGNNGSQSSEDVTITVGYWPNKANQPSTYALHEKYVENMKEKYPNIETKGFETVRFIGLQNYIEVISDSLFVKSVLNSFAYTFWSVVIGGFTPLIVAIMLNEVVKGKGFFRFVMYFPCIIPGIVTAIMWKVLFQPNMNGFLNMIFNVFGLGPFQWLQNAKATIPLIVFTMTWGAFGSTMFA